MCVCVIGPIGRERAISGIGGNYEERQKNGKTSDLTSHRPISEDVWYQS